MDKQREKEGLKSVLKISAIIIVGIFVVLGVIVAHEMQYVDEYDDMLVEYNVTMGDRYETETFLPRGMVMTALDYIRNNPGSLLPHVLDAALKPLFPANKLDYRVGAAYRVLETLLAEGLVKLVPEERTGSAGAPGTLFGIYAVEQ